MQIKVKLASFDKAVVAGDKGISIDAPGAPVEGSDAGDSEDLSQAYLRSVVQENTQEARRLYKLARNTIAANADASRVFADKALHHAAKAFWWAEDSRYEVKQHALIHEIALWKSQNLGCYMQFEGGQYQQRCTVVLTHKKVGFSVGMLTQFECSICDGDLTECPHRRGRAYWVRGTRNAEGKCRICNELDCGHRDDEVYRTRVIATGRKSILEEVSIVRRPANPDARLQAVPYGASRIAKLFGPTYGMPVRCYVCSNACPGFTEKLF